MIVFNVFFIDWLFHFLVLMGLSLYFIGKIEITQQVIYALAFGYVITYINHTYFKRYTVRWFIEKLKRFKKWKRS